MKSASDKLELVPFSETYCSELPYEFINCLATKHSEKFEDIIQSNDNVRNISIPVSRITYLTRVILGYILMYIHIINLEKIP